MCGIAGYLGARQPGLAERMTGLLAHRGPDDAGESVFAAADGGRVAVLAHRRLSIIDVEGGHQPLASEDGAVQAVFNGAIYNFRELRAGLERRGHVFRTRSDTEVLVHLYEEHLLVAEGGRVEVRRYWALDPDAGPSQRATQRDCGRCCRRRLSCG